MENSELHKNVLKFGYWAALSTAVLTIITFTVAMLTPPLSGPFCEENCFQYPFTEIASRFPRDYYWMYLAIVLSFLYLLMMLAIHQSTKNEKKLFSLISISFAIMSSCILIIDYFIQVSVIQPSLLAGETDGISILSQFNPHGIFIVFEELGFMLMIISFFALIPVFSKNTKLDKAIKWTALIGFCLSIISFLLISMIHGIQREYRFEVVVISIAWIELIILSFLFFNHFKKASKSFSD
ncbi:MAG: hypothetical protein UR43_C0026G0008 [candidate division TM6 bacterium GW2011_GWF2_33_332]|nr:MAG: hypothetical protein UR43_C0026G0008 [candidate division TM6 bacterium GW2011_GWF2_33_332]